MNKLGSVIAVMAITTGSLGFFALTAPETYAGCNSGLGRLDPTCPGRIFNPPENSGAELPVQPPLACRDPWVTKAVSKVTGRTPKGFGDTGECNIRLYGGGQWGNYQDLVSKVEAAFSSFAPGVCRDPWVTRAVNEVTGRTPKGYGELGECNMYLYGKGSWQNYPDLLTKVRTRLRR